MDENKTEPSKAEQTKAKSREVVNTVGKAAGKTYMEAHGVPAPVADFAVNQAARNPLVQRQVNKAADNPLLRNQLARSANLVNAAKPLLEQQAKGAAGAAGAAGTGGGVGKSGDSEAGAGSSPKKEVPGNKSKKMDSEKSAAEKDSADASSSFGSGSFKVGLSRLAMIKLGLIGGAAGIIIIFFVSALAMLSDTLASGLIMGKMVADGDVTLGEVIGIIKDDVGRGDQVGMAPMDPSDPLYEYQNRFESLGNVFSSMYNCDKDEQCIMDREEYIYFLKIADITLRYKNKYGITLDWVLLNATALYNRYTQEETMGLHRHDYNKDNVENYSILMDLDWDYDYKKIPGYQYLDRDDYRYDLQILAKNMVKKTTTQTCTRPKYENGVVVGVEVVKQQVDEDVEEQYFKPGESHYLECPSGTSYSISSVYVLDKEKYDEFLLEYLEHKFYLEGSGGSYDWSKYTGEFIYPLPDQYCVGSRRFGMMFHPIYKEWRFHAGIDMGAPQGTPAYSVADGTVVDVGYNSSAGNYVAVDHGNGYKSRYLHASTVLVKVGQKVSQGEPVILVGTTGASTGPHLHFELYEGGQVVDPLFYIPPRLC